MDLPKELGLVGNQQNIVLTVFFAPYIVFEIPSNIIMKKISPQIWLSACITGFGIIMLCQGFVKNYSGLIATRFFLGLCEAGIFPGSFYLISFWYKHEESQKRFTVYWSTTIFAGAFGGLLASAIGKMDGIRGLSNWRWIFILEGIATILIGILALFFITDFPKEAKWLSEKERAFILHKTRHDESHAVPVTTKDVLKFFTKLKNWVAAIMYFCTSDLTDPHHKQSRILIQSSDPSSRVLYSILPPNYRQGAWLRDHRGPVAFSPTFRCYIWLCCGHILLLRQVESAFAIHLLRPRPPHHRSCHLDFGPRRRTLLGRIRRHLPHGHGFLRDRWDHRMLVHHEPTGPCGAKHRIGMDDLLWKLRWHRGDLYLLGEGQAVLSFGLQYLLSHGGSLCRLKRLLPVLDLAGEKGSIWKRRRE